MQNVQNAAEIQQRVINLVELYRNKVGKESQIAKDAKADCEYWHKEPDDGMMEEGLAVGGGMYGEGPHTEVWIKHLMVNEQLLGYFYALVAGENAEKEILDQLLPDVYDKTIFTKEEELFLTTHFKEMVNYIILTPCDDSLEWVHRHDGKDAYTIPKDVLELVKGRVEIPAGSTVYYPNTAFAQLANLFNGCKYYCDTMFYAWTKVAVYANNIDAEDNATPSSYDAIVSYLPKDDDDSKAIAHLCDAYKNLPVSGKLVLICPPSVLVGKDNTSYRRVLSETLKYKELPSIKEKLDEEEASADINAQFRRILVKDKSIKEIIQMPQIMSNNASFDTYCLLIAEKGRTENDVLLVDARTASNDFDTKHYMLSFDNAKFNAIMHNGGIDPNTGLRKTVTISTDYLSPELLVPQVYTIERPSEAEHPVPLSTLCTLETTSVRDVQYDLPEDTPWISMSDLTPLFTGDMDLSTIRKAYCPNNPRFVEGSKDYAFNEEGKFVDSIWDQMYTKRGYLVLEYRQCTFIDGNSDTVLYERSVEHGVHVAIVRSTDKPFAVSKGILVFRPKNGVEANTLAAMLRLPIVRRQLLAYQQFGIGNHLSDIFVPTDKRVVGDELYRMEREKSVTRELEDNYVVAQKKHKVKLEDYQHAMRKHIREISSSVRRMERFINDMNSLDEGKRFLIDRLAVIKRHRLYLSEDIERLNEENTYGEASPFDIDHCLRSYREYFGSDVCTMKYTNEIANEAIRQYLNEHQVELKNLDEKSRYKNIEMVSSESGLAYVDIAEYNFGKIVRNILENAKKHGFDDFVDVNRKDCIIEITLNWDKERNMYRIDFRNNGNSLPEGLTKDSYGENRKYAGRTGGTGIGGYEVAENVKHYDGDYSISQDGGWVVVSIYLPKSKKYEQERL